MTSLIEMPFDLDGGRPFVSVETPGHRPLKFFLDTGAGFSAIDEGLARDLGLALGEVRGNRLYHAVAYVQRLNIPVVNRECPWMQAQPGLSDRAQVDGLIGGDIFGRYIVEFDYQSRRVRFSNPKEYKAPIGSKNIGICVKSCCLEIDVGDGINHQIKTNDPYVKAELIVGGSRSHSATLLIDTGLPTSLVVSRAFTKRYGILDNVESRIQSICPLASYGIGECEVGRLEALSIGDSGLKIPSPIVSFYQKPMWESSGDYYDGIIGHEILRRFRIAFDYGNKRMILKRNDEFDQRYEFDMSGTYLKPHPEGFELWKLTGDPSDSPAIEARLKEGDIIIAINGKRASSFTGDEFHKLFMEEGEYRLDVSRQDGVFTTCLTTRRLI